MGEIYAIGGHSDQPKSKKSVEKYDPVFISWSYFNKMNVEKRGHSACVMPDKIYVVGGKNAKNEFVFEVECYKPFWSIVARKKERLFRHSIVAI